MKKFFILFACSLFISSFYQTLTAQEKDLKKEKKESYKFKTIAEIKTTPVQNQYKSGTCWSFAATSFFETEILRIKESQMDISEMYFVRYAYIDKAILNVRYHGRFNYSPGGQAHDVLNTIKEHGMLPESVYDGLEIGEDKHNHGEMDAVLKGFMEAVVKKRGGKITPKWIEAYSAILDVYLGEVPEEFEYNGTLYSPISFAKFSGVDPENYIELTSFSHHPFYQKVNLEIPDNWSDDDYYNVPLDDLISTIDHALHNNYSVCWDGDVSDKGFSHQNGVAIIPDVHLEDLNDTERSRWEELSEKEKQEQLYKFDKPGTEKEITQSERQEDFDNYTATDDHLMHLTGIVEDQRGTKYYITKNSWGTERNEFGGYLNMSESYTKLNTIAIMIHKDAIPDHIATKLNLNK